MTALDEILSRMKSIKLWAVVAAVVVAGAAAYYGFDALTGPNAEESDAQTQLVPVTRGSLVNDVSVTGTLLYTTRETVTFGQQGTVAEVAVSEGDRVSAGDAMAALDSETTANLEKAIAQARIDVRSAEDALEEARNPYTAAQIAKAESDVANARLDLRQAEDALGELTTPSDESVAQARIDVLNAQDALEAAREHRDALDTPDSQDLARARSKVTTARVALQDAKDDLDALINPSDDALNAANAAVTNARLGLESAVAALDELVNVPEQDIAKARAAVADAQLELDAAQEAVDEARTAKTAQDAADHQAELDSAESALLTARFNLQTAERNADDKIQNATEDLDTAQEDYNALFVKWLGMDGGPPWGLSPDDTFAAHGIDLDSVFDVDFIDGLRLLSDPDLLHDDPETPWDEVVVYSWTILHPGDVFVDCGTREAGIHRACILDEFNDAYDAVQELTDTLEIVQSDETEKVRAARAAVAKAENTVAQRQEALDDYLAGVTESELESRVEALELAKANLATLKQDLAELVAGPDPLDVESGRQDVVAAETKLAESLDALAELTAPDALSLESRRRAVETAEADLLDAETALAELTQAAESDVELADNEIEMAQANLADAEETLAALLDDPDSIDLHVKETAVHLAAESLAEAEETLLEYNTIDRLEIELRQADLVAARAALDTAIADLERASLPAPIDGIVVAVNIEEGQQVNPNTEAVEMADPSVVEVSGSVDEIDVLFLREGADAFVVLEALGGQALPGTVSAIASSGTSQQGIVTYPVTIRVDSSQSGQLPEGLSATAQVVIREETDKLLIPLQALYGSAQEPTVRVVNGNDVTERQVSLGISDDFWVVVEEGLDEGEVVSMEVVGSDTSLSGGIGATFRAVGGFVGGGRGPGPGPRQ